MAPHFYASPADDQVASGGAAAPSSGTGARAVWRLRNQPGRKLPLGRQPRDDALVRAPETPFPGSTPRRWWRGGMVSESEGSLSLFSPSPSPRQLRRESRPGELGVTKLRRESRPVELGVTTVAALSATIAASERRPGELVVQTSEQPMVQSPIPENFMAEKEEQQGAAALPTDEPTGQDQSRVCSAVGEATGEDGDDDDGMWCKHWKGQNERLAEDLRMKAAASLQAAAARGDVTEARALLRMLAEVGFCGRELEEARVALASAQQEELQTALRAVGVKEEVELHANKTVEREEKIDSAHAAREDAQHRRQPIGFLGHDREWVSLVSAERKLREEAELHAKELAAWKGKAEQERKAKEEAERQFERHIFQEEVDRFERRKFQEEVERVIRENEREQEEIELHEAALRKARADAEREAKEEAERKIQEEADRHAKEVAVWRARVVQERKAKEDVERKFQEEMERSSRGNESSIEGACAPLGVTHEGIQVGGDAVTLRPDADQAGDETGSRKSGDAHHDDCGWSTARNRMFEAQASISILARARGCQDNFPDLPSVAPGPLAAATYSPPARLDHGQDDRASTLAGESMKLAGGEASAGAQSGGLFPWQPPWSREGADTSSAISQPAPATAAVVLPNFAAALPVPLRQEVDATWGIAVDRLGAAIVTLAGRRRTVDFGAPQGIPAEKSGRSANRL